MANVDIQRVGPGEYDLLARLYNEVLRPPVAADFFRRRFEHRAHALALVAQLEGKPVGFVCGYDLRPSTFYAWLCGVSSDARRMGVASQLMEAQSAWAREHGFEMMRFECPNFARPMLHVAIRDGFDIVGIRWDARAAHNLVIFEKHLSDA